MKLEVTNQDFEDGYLKGMLDAAYLYENGVKIVPLKNTENA